jgi:cyclophilin family peptidyl-prolyl cis-trans isomerase
MVAGRIEPRDVGRILATFDDGWQSGMTREFGKTDKIGPASAPFLRYVPRLDTGQHHVLSAWSRGASAARAKAAALVAVGNRVSLYVFSADTRFHRVRAAYIAQWGLHGDSAVNAAWKGRYLRDDAPRSQNTRGTFAFSYEGPGRENTRNTQIYVNLADNPKNDAEPFTVLGTVVEGMSVLDSLYSGYGEDSGSGVRQGKQGPLERGGNAYMDREFPKLDRITRVVISTP